VKRKSHGANKRQQALRVWSYAEAQAARPYLTSVVGSLREHALEALTQRRRLEQFAARPGRPDRHTLIAQQEAERLGREAGARFEEAAEELQTLDVFSLDPLQGQALVPFVHDDQLAWYVFDLFDAQPFRFWRFQSDPEDTRRPVGTLPKDTASPA